MLMYALLRILLGFSIMVGVTVLIYALLLAAPGGPEQKYANNPRYTEVQKQAYIAALGLDKPVFVQYCRWIGACRRDADGIEALLGPTGLPAFLPTPLSGISTGILHGEFGYSYVSGEDVMYLIAGAALPTLILAGLSIVIWLSTAVILGVVMGIRSGGKFDNTMSVVTYVSYSLPTFLLGFVMIWLFAIVLDLTPVSGMTNSRISPAFGSDLYWEYFGAYPIEALLDLAAHLILPVHGARPNRSREGALWSQGDHAPCAANRTHPLRHQHWLGTPVPLRWRARNRDDLRLARDWSPHTAGNQ